MSNQPSGQKRGSFRVAAKISARFLPIEAITDTPISNETPVEHWIAGEINDLSIGGVRLTGPLEMGGDTLVALCFTPPSAFLDEMLVERDINEMSPFGMRIRTVQQREADFEEFEICGRILRVAVDSKKREFQYHIAFVDIPPRMEEELSRFVTLSQRYQLQQRNKYKN